MTTTDSSRRAGFWAGALSALQQMGRVDDAVMLAFQLDDAATLTALCKGGLPQQLWARVARAAALREAQGAGERPTVDCAWVLRACKPFLGSSAAAAVMLDAVRAAGKEEPARVAIARESLQRLLREAALRHQQDAVAREMLEAINAHTWTQGSAAPLAASQLRAVIGLEEDAFVADRERRARADAMGPVHAQLRGLPGVSVAERAPEEPDAAVARRLDALGCIAAATESAAELFRPLPRFYDDTAMSSHWGVRAELQTRCPVCCTPVELEGGAVRGGRRRAEPVSLGCGHVFHEDCATGDACVACFGAGGYARDG